MSTPVTTNYKRVKKIVSESFSVEKLSSYSLCVQIGTRDLQFCVINTQTSSCIYLEDYKLESIKTVNSRVEAIKEIFTTHSFLLSDQWDSIHFAFKSHKFSLIPASFFLPETASDYLALNSEIKTKIEDVYYYKHIGSDIVNVFAADLRLTQWAKRTFKQNNLQILHQGSAFIEGIPKSISPEGEKEMFAYADRGILHLVVATNGKLDYYNQFAVRKAEDFLKYTMLVFKELGLSSKESKLTIWGMVKADAPQVALLGKYIKNVTLGGQPSFLKFASEFDQLGDHRYFDLYSIFICK